MASRENAEALQREKMKRRVRLEGCRLLALRAVENTGFSYTQNLAGLGGGASICLCYWPAGWEGDEQKNPTRTSRRSG